MKRTQFNSLPNYSSSNINVDRENGTLKNVSIANFGKNKNNAFFDEKFISDLVEKGNAQTQGVKARFGHPTMCATSLGTYIGRYKNFNVQNGNCYADLHLDPISKKTQVEGKGISMFEYIMDMAESNPDMFGNSIHITYVQKEKPVLKEGYEVLELNDINSSDLVDDPAATTALFSSNPNDLGVAITEFLDSNPAIFETISKQPSIIGDFFDRYANYTNRKSLINFNMSFLDDLKKKFEGKKEGKTFDKDVTLGDGTIITVVTDAEEPKVGDKVVDSTGKPLPNKEGEPDAKNILPDGSTIVTVDGEITEIIPAPKEGEEQEPTMAEVMNSVKNLATSFGSFKSKFESAQKDNETAFGILGDQIMAFDKRVTDMGNTITSKKFDAPPAEDGKPKPKTSGYDADAVAEARERIKNKNNK